MREGGLAAHGVMGDEPVDGRTAGLMPARAGGRGVVREQLQGGRDVPSCLRREGGHGDGSP